MAARAVPDAVRARGDQSRSVAVVLRAAGVGGHGRRRRPGRCFGDRRGTRYRESGVVVLVPTEAEARARAGIARQLDRDALRTVDVRADARR